MILYSGTTCPFSQRCRFVLYEKGMDFEIHDVDTFNMPQELIDKNPYKPTVPILIDRELTLHESNIINEYLDERFPHPQLMPPDPQLRAKARLMLFKIEKELFEHVKTLEDDAIPENSPRRTLAQISIREYLTKLSPMFANRPFMLGEEFSMLDVAIAPLLWRLGHYGIDMPKSAAPILKYSERIFSRPAYIEALTAPEKIMRK